MLLDRLIANLEQRGLAVKPGAEPGQLVLSGPTAEKTPEVMAAVKAFKPQLLERFARPDPTGEPRGDAVVTDPNAHAPLPPDRAAGLTTVDPHNCRECNGLILAVPDRVTGAFCESPTCPSRRGSSRG
jgi:hypothetical protein